MTAAVTLPPVAPPRPLTERQRQVLDYIRAFRLEHGRSPTIRQIGNEMGLRSTNAVSDNLKALKRKGYITVDAGQACGIVLLARPGVPDIAPPVHEDPLVSKLAIENVELRALLRRAQIALTRIEAASLDVAGVLGDVRQALGDR